jgi:hypothetical protein
MSMLHSLKIVISSTGRIRATLRSGQISGSIYEKQVIEWENPSAIASIAGRRDGLFLQPFGKLLSSTSPFSFSSSLHRHHHY